MAEDKKARIRELNDALRTKREGGQIVETSGVNQLPGDVRLKAQLLIGAFDDFTEENDPHGEHDFGAVEVEGYRIFWKIDYYDKAVEYGSEDPADPEVTHRVMTVMLAEEY